jgi:hypothetical protein
MYDKVSSRETFIDKVNRTAYRFYFWVKDPWAAVQVMILTMKKSAAEIDHFLFQKSSTYIRQRAY